MKIDDQQAAQQLEQMFKSAEGLYLQQCIPDVNPSLIPIANDLFKSPTKSYREALLGCGLAKLLNPAINIRHPYMNHGDDAFNGRTMDEAATAQGLRDKKGYQAFLSYLEAFEKATNEEAKIFFCISSIVSFSYEKNITFSSCESTD